jgi:hypothetical protein
VDGDGTYDWSNDTTGVAQWTYDTPGNYTAKLRVTDNIGDFATATVAVEVKPKPPNMKPVADAGDDEEVEQGDPVEFVMAGYDPDGIIVPGHDPPHLLRPGGVHRHVEGHRRRGRYRDRQPDHHG